MAHVRTHKRGDGAAAYEVRWRQAGRFKQRTFKVKRDADGSLCGSRTRSSKATPPTSTSAEARRSARLPPRP
jgi:hypothetical protein